MGDATGPGFKGAATRRSLRGSSVCFVLGAFLVSLLLPASAAAAATLTANVRIGDGCIVGGVGAAGSVRLVWKDANGSLKARADVPLNSNNYWVYCSDTEIVQSTDTIKMSDGVVTRTVTIPLVTLVLDRATDTFSGRAPANADGLVYWHAGLFEDYIDGDQVTSDGDGNWSITPTAFDLTGGISSWVEWTTDHGDRISLAPRITPFVRITLNRPKVTGYSSDPDQAVTVKLKNPLTSTLIGVASATANADRMFDARFVDAEGRRVVVSAGQRIKSTLAADLDWVVPVINLSADVANDSVSGRCGDTANSYGRAVVSVHRAGQQVGFALPYPDSNGDFSIDFTQNPDIGYDPVNIRHGDRVWVDCIRATGDSVQRLLIVP